MCNIQDPHEVGEQLNVAGAWLHTVSMQKEAGCVWVGRTCRWNTWKLPCCRAGRSPAAALWKVGGPCVPSAFFLSSFSWKKMFFKCSWKAVCVLEPAGVTLYPAFRCCCWLTTNNNADFFFLSTDLIMTGQSKGTTKSKVKISPVLLGILLWDSSFPEICLLFSIKTDSHDTKSQKRQLPHWYLLFFNAVCANQGISPGQKKGCSWSGNEVVQMFTASEVFCQTAAQIKC